MSAPATTFGRFVCLLAGLAAGCAVKPPGVTSGSPGLIASGTTGGAAAPATPVLTPGTPSATPAPSVCISGTAVGATGVVITGGAAPVETETDGTNGSTFKADVPLVPGTTNSLAITALSGEGPISSSVPLVVTQSASAPSVGAYLCSKEPALPDDGGATDCSDPQQALCLMVCNHCHDGYEPNATPAEAPELTGIDGGLFPVPYVGLTLCPCIGQEWFSIVAPAGAKIDVNVVPSTHGTWLGLELVRPADWPLDAGNPIIASAVANGGGAGDAAHIQWIADTTSLYDIGVFGNQPDASVPYTMVLQNFTVPFPVDAGIDAGLPTGPGDAGPGIGGGCTVGPGADPSECNPATPYCDINPPRPHPQCVAGAQSTIGESCNLAVSNPDNECNFGRAGTEVVCSDVGGQGQCVQGRCNSAYDCLSGDGCSANQCQP